MPTEGKVLQGKPVQSLMRKPQADTGKKVQSGAKTLRPAKQSGAEELLLWLRRVARGPRLTEEHW